MRFVVLIIVTVVLTSCVSLRPDSDSISYPDYNERTKVNNPHYVKRTNAVGHIFTLSCAVAGGYGAYQAGRVQRPTESGTEKVDVANIALGSLVGASTGVLLNYIMGHKKVQPLGLNDRGDWIWKANKSYRLYAYDKNSLTVIPRRMDRSFSFRSIDDLYGYDKVFMPSNYLDRNLLESLPDLNRGALLNAWELWNKKLSKESLEMLYEELFTKTNTIETLYDLLSFTTIDEERVINKSLEIADSFKDYKKMYDYYPSVRGALYIGFLIHADSYAGLRFIYDRYKSDEQRDDVLLRAKYRTGSFEDAMSFLEHFPEQVDIIAPVALVLIEDCYDLRKFNRSFSSYRDFTTSQTEECDEKRAIATGLIVSGISMVVEAYSGKKSLGEAAVVSATRGSQATKIIRSGQNIIKSANAGQFSLENVLVSLVKCKGQEEFLNDVNFFWIIQHGISLQDVEDLTKSKLEDELEKYLEKKGHTDLLKRKEYISILDCIFKDMAN